MKLKVFNGEAGERPIELGNPNPRNISEDDWWEFGDACGTFGRTPTMADDPISSRVLDLIEIVTSIATDPDLRLVDKDDSSH